MAKFGVVGNQEGWNYSFIKEILDKYHMNEWDVIISGGAKGVDTFAQQYAQEKGITIIIHYPRPDLPSPQRYFERNKQIAEECDILVAFDKKSGAAGTKNTISLARKAKKMIVVHKGAL